MPKEKSTKTTDNYEIIMPDPGFKLKPAIMNKTYAELELDEGAIMTAIRKKAYKAAALYFVKI